MEELIKQAFLHVDVIGPHVHQGHYDLVGPDGEIILPQIWETMIQPDWTVTMHMWPMPEPPPPEPPQPEFLPPPPPLDAQEFMSRDLPLKKGSKSHKTKKRESAHVVQVPPPPPGVVPLPPPPPPGPEGAFPPGVVVMPAEGPKKPRKKPQPSPFFRWAAGTVPAKKKK
jgi:hypothetical protein